MIEETNLPRLSDALVESATEKDAAELEKLHALLFSDDETSTSEHRKGEIEKALKQNLVWVARADGKIVGYQICELFDEDQEYFPNSVFLAGVYVLGPFRNRGIARKLIEQSLSHTYPSKFTYFSLTHDPNEAQLTAYYKSFGFEEQGKTRVGNIKMVRPMKTK